MASYQLHSTAPRRNALADTPREPVSARTDKLAAELPTAFAGWPEAIEPRCDLRVAEDPKACREPVAVCVSTFVLVFLLLQAYVDGVNGFMRP
jgi:hypothetical protein